MNPRQLPVVVEHDKSTTQVIADKAVKTGRALGKTSVRLAQPIVKSIKHEDNRTLAKMVVAAATPRLINYGLRFAVRNPVLTVAGILVAATIIGSQDDGAQEES
ncbi:hypothetical protein [Sphingobium sp. B12D2B]|uniref:hypothetical protein n=1 Tax=Sphingobium sp. B12D2B TaxID=2940577 RepID=UPI00222585A7|nr:hypothetical protein [Sphingobium sp. B12D2B]MCW2351013.1 hypothetical protein [Sphingobium sp. B12D2B]